MNSIDIQKMIETALKQIESPKEKITVTIKGKQCNQDGWPKRQRTIIVSLKGQDAQDFQSHPTLDAIWDAYGVWLGDGVSDDGKQAILIETIAIS